MRHDPLFLLWTVHCSSPEECRRLLHWLPGEITPEAVFVDEVRAFPGGLETCSREPHRLGDSFVSVRLLPPPGPASSSFQLLFHRRPSAPRAWKDLMVRVLQKVRQQTAAATTTLDYRGDEEPAALAARS